MKKLGARRFSKVLDLRTLAMVAGGKDPLAVNVTFTVEEQKYSPGSATVTTTK